VRIRREMTVFTERMHNGMKQLPANKRAIYVKYGEGFCCFRHMRL
jgi:hypothetical protein